MTIDAEIHALAKSVIKQAKAAGLTIATAESCTGGGNGAALTGVSGSSAVFEGGIIAYANTAKTNLLGVPQDTINTHGAVSEQTALAMADGARKVLNTDLAVSVTGIAGPTGGTKDKPVGTVWIGLAQKGKTTIAQHFLFMGNRENVRRETTLVALSLVLQELTTQRK